MRSGKDLRNKEVLLLLAHLSVVKLLPDKDLSVCLATDLHNVNHKIRIDALRPIYSEINFIFSYLPVAQIRMILFQ